MRYLFLVFGTFFFYANPELAERELDIYYSVSAEMNICVPMTIEDVQLSQSDKEYIQLIWPYVEQSIVPAPIKIAQAILESNRGKSLLTKSNNHFGIKAHQWKGDIVKFYDDETEKSSFRVYDSTAQNFIDHDNFLKQNKRYNDLWNIPYTDYVAWAHGLKKAGYATDPDYAKKLIYIIENNGLDKLYSSQEKIITVTWETKG